MKERLFDILRKPQEFLRDMEKLTLEKDKNSVVLINNGIELSIHQEVPLYYIILEYVIKLEKELFFLEDDYTLDERESNQIDFLKEIIEDLKFILQDY
jgi:hypothetical protein